MARYRGSVCRLCRREGTKLFLKGDRCFSEKCAIERRAYPPGMHGQGRVRFSDFGVQLREKQKVKRMYGLLEKQFRKAFVRASSMKGRSGENLLVLLGLITLFFAWATQPQERRPGNWSSTDTSRWMGKRSRRRLCLSNPV